MLFPRMMWKERRLVFSKEEMDFMLGEGLKIHKQALLSLYPFTTIRDRKPVEESIIIDKLLFEGSLNNLERLAKDLTGYTYTIHSCNGTYLLVNIDVLHEELEQHKTYYDSMYNVNTNTNLKRMLVIPGTIDLKTGNESKILKEFK